MKSSRLQNVLNHFFGLLLFAFIFVNALHAFAGPGRTTYQAKIVKPDGYPLEASSVNFKFTILDPAGSCILYSETYSSVNMSSTGGLISFALGSGVKTYPTSSTTTFEQVFSNITPSLSCDTGGPANYTPTATDIRKIVMQFHDGTGWQTLPAMNINAVPYAMYANEATKLNGLQASDFVQVSTVPTCATSEALRYTGAGFTCVAVGNSVTSSTVVTALGYTPADGVSVTALSSNVSSVSSTLFSVSSTVTSLQNSVAASFAAITSSQWTTSGTNIFYNTGNIGIGTSTPVTKLDVSGGVRIGTESSTCAPALAGTLRYNASNVEYCNGSSWQAFGVSGAGINNFNGSTSGTQTLATGTGGTAPAFNTSNGVHTLNIPNASTGSVTAGLISNADYTTFSNKITSSAASIAQVLGYTPANDAVSGTYAQKANNLSDLTNITTARTNLGLGTFATASSIDLGSASATGTLAIARLPSFTGDATIAAASNTIILANSGVTAGTYTKVVVDNKGRVTSGSLIASSDVTTALGYTPASASAATQWTTSGSAIYYNTGNVGIGTASPAANLHVVNSAASPASAQIMQYNTTRAANNKYGIEFRDSSNEANASVAVIQSGAGNNAAALVFGTSAGTGGNGISTPVERMRLDNAGNVGIATSAPTNKLHISATSTANWSPDMIALDRGANTQENGIVWKTAGANRWTVQQDNDGTENLRLYSAGTASFIQSWDYTTGNVGIGTTAPTAGLHLAAGTSSNASFKFTSGTLLTSPQSGTMEYDGTNFYVTDGTNIRRTIATGSNAGTIDNASNINSSGNITMTPVGSVVVSSTTASINSSTGALIVKGGLGVTGNINTAANLNVSGSSVIDGSLKLSSMTSGSVLFAGANGVISQDNSNFYWDGSNKRLGIGASNPLARLQVAGNILIDGASNDSPNFIFRDASSSGTWNIDSYQERLRFFTESNIDVGGGAERMTLTASGNVGIGTSAPTARLSLKSSGTDTYPFDVTASNGNKILQLYENNASHGQLLLNDGNGSTKVWLSSSTNSYFTGGNVGIGTTNPTTKLSMNVSAAYDGLRIDSTSNGFLHSYVNAGAGSNNGITQAGDKSIIYGGSAIDSAGGLVIAPWKSNTSGIRLDASGNVGIGTSTPGTLLDVNGVARAATYTFPAPVGDPAPVITARTVPVGQGSANEKTELILFHSNDPANGSGNDQITLRAPALSFQTYNDAAVADISNNSGYNERMYITPTGNVGIGTTAPQSLLHVGGSQGVVLSNGVNTWPNTSVIKTFWYSGIGDTTDILVPGASSNTAILRLTSTGNVGIGAGASSPVTRLDVNGAISNLAGNLRKYMGYNLTMSPVADGVNAGYLLLAKAYTSGNVSDSEVQGRFTFSRGSTGSGNRTDVLEVSSKSAYQSEYFLANNLNSNSSFVSGLYKVTYGGVVYHAIGIGATGGNADQGVVFDGITQNATPVIVKDTDVSGVTSYGSVGFVVTSSGNIGIGMTSPSTALEVSGTVKATAFSGPGILLQTINLSAADFVSHTTSVWLDVPNLSSTFTTAVPTTVDIVASGMYRTMNSSVGNVRLVINGTEVAGDYIQQAPSAGTHHANTSINWAQTLAAGTHTIKVQWRNENATGSFDQGWNDSGRVLSRRLKIMVYSQ